MAQQHLQHLSPGGGTRAVAADTTLGTAHARAGFYPGSRCVSRTSCCCRRRAPCARKRRTCRRNTAWSGRCECPAAQPPKYQRHGSATCPARDKGKMSEYSTPPASSSRREPGPARSRPTISGDKAVLCQPSCHRIQRPTPRRPNGQKPRTVQKPAEANSSVRRSHPNGARGVGGGRQRAWLFGAVTFCQLLRQF